MEFKLPELGEGVHEGELVSWRVKPGDKVVDDQPLCDIMTDKATIEIPSPFSGVIKELHAKEGEIVAVGALLVSLEGAGKSSAAEKPKEKEEKKAESKPAPAPAAAAKSAPSQPVQQSYNNPTDTHPATRVLAAPSTRRMASEMGVDLGTVKGSGPEGRVMKKDVQNFLGAFPAGAPTFAKGAPSLARATTPTGGEERVPFKGLRRKIAEKMRQSKDKAAHFTYVEECDATELVNLRAQAKELGAQQGIKVTYLPFLMKAMVAALRQYPVLNSSLDEEKNELVYKHFYNIAISVQTDDGLTAPVIKNVESKSVLQIAQEIQAVVERARNKKLALDDLQGGTITLTNAGSIGGLFATPVINYPEVAILGFNKIFRKPVVKTVGGKEEIVIRDWTYFSLSLDHRVVDGAIGAEFMNTFVKYIENPSLLLLESL